jgi:arsenate reductase
LQEQGVELEFRDLGKERFTVAELDRLIGDRDHREFLNPRNDLYRGRNMKEKPPSRAEALKLMTAEPNLIRRPIVIFGGRIVVGYDEDALKKF